MQPEPRHAGGRQQRHFVEAAILSSAAELLAHYHAIVKLSRSHAVMALPQGDALAVLHYACPPPEPQPALGTMTADELARRAGACSGAATARGTGSRPRGARSSPCASATCRTTSSRRSRRRTRQLREPAGLVAFLATCHRVMHLKFGALARGVLEELRSIDALNARASELNAASALVVVAAAGQQRRDGATTTQQDDDRAAATADGGGAAGGGSGGGLAQVGALFPAPPRRRRSHSARSWRCCTTTCCARASGRTASTASSTSAPSS